MSILIRGMNMPISCEKCPCKTADAFGGLGCQATGYIPLRKENQDRPDWCPLIPVPQHGRLIDADRLENIVFESLNNAITDCNPTPFGEALCMSIAKNIVDEIGFAPTIIQADKPKKEVSDDNVILKIEEK